MSNNNDKQINYSCLQKVHSLSYQKNHLNKYLHNIDKVRSYLSKIPVNLYLSKQLSEHIFEYHIADKSFAEGLYSLFYLGNFEKVYHFTSINKYGLLLYLGDKNDFHTLHNILSNNFKIDDIILSKLPSYGLLDMNVEQSSEDSNENYPEVLAAQELIRDIFNNKIEITAEYIDSLSKEEEASLRFALAEKQLYIKDYRAAYELYLYATFAEPSKAIYYGFASNMIYKLLGAGEHVTESDIIEMVITARRAVDLDFNNARWHLYLAYALSCAAIKLNYINKELISNFFDAAIEEYYFAKSLIRTDQSSLLRAIDMSITSTLDALKRF